MSLLPGEGPTSLHEDGLHLLHGEGCRGEGEAFH